MLQSVVMKPTSMGHVMVKYPKRDSNSKTLCFICLESDIMSMYLLIKWREFSIKQGNWLILPCFNVLNRFVNKPE